MLRVFDIYEPATVQDAAALLAEHGPDAAVYAGGTELLLLMKEGLVHYPHLVNIKTIPGLKEVAVDGDGGALRIGPLATHRDLARLQLVQEHAPLLAEVEQQVANIRVRAMGTIGGNLCFGEPHSDPATLLLAWDATLELSSTEGCRRVPAGDFFVDLLETAREPDEVLTGIHLLPLPPQAAGAYEKFSLHERPTATVAAILAIQDGVIAGARLSVGSVGPTPLRARAAEERLMGERPEADLFAAAATDAAVAVDPVDDLYGSADYKRHLVRVLAARALARAAGRVP